MAFRTLPENSKNQAGPVLNTGPQSLLKISFLSRGQFVIEDHNGGILTLQSQANFLDLTGADI